jgi:flagellar biosynthesis/type III secretory pathway protein FliH
MTDRPIPFAKQSMTKAKWGTKRRIMHAFKMTEISGVDVPAQEGALILLQKRAPDTPDAPTPESFCKVAFREALDQSLLDRRFNDAFYRAFEDQWTANDALRQALQDGYQNSEETVRQYVETIAAMAQQAATATRDLVKSADMNDTISRLIADACDTFTKQVSKEPTMIKTLADLKAAIKAFDPNSATATVEAVVIKSAAAALSAETELPGDGPLAKEAPKSDPALTKALREIELLKMDAPTRGYFDGLDEPTQTAFLAKDAAARTAEVEAANATDPVMYKCKDGTEIRKSDGAVALMMAKRMDAQDATIAKLLETHEDSSFAKAARTDYANLPEDSTVELLKAAEAITDPDKKKKALEALRAASKAAGSKFKVIGGGGPVSKRGEGGDGDANAKLDEMAKAHQAANTGMSFEKAYTAVLDTPEGKALFNETVGFEADADT